MYKVTHTHTHTHTHKHTHTHTQEHSDTHRNRVTNIKGKHYTMKYTTLETNTDLSPSNRNQYCLAREVKPSAKKRLQVSLISVFPKTCHLPS